MKKFAGFKKTVAVFTSFVFMLTCLFSDLSYAIINSAAPVPAFGADNFISPSLGKITSAKYYDSSEIIINIQDLHCHAETQRKISSIIEQIDMQYKLNNVYLEGAYDKVDTSWLSKFNDGKSGTKVLENLIDSGKLSGTEFYSIMNNRNNFILPIEDEKVYKENMSLLGQIISHSPEIDAVCAELEKEIGTAKKAYSNRKTQSFDTLVKNFRSKKINAGQYYKELKKFINTAKIDMTVYPNISAYIQLVENSSDMNDRAVIAELKNFMAELKNRISYQDYANLIKKSGNFSKIEDITDDLVEFDAKYEIGKKAKLHNFEKFLQYLKFNKTINPVKFVREEEQIIDVIFAKFGRTKYEKEVSYLSEFLPKIKQYFTANISADEYYSFEKDFQKFRLLWPSYFRTETVKKLDKFRELLSIYHNNNIRRDNIFAGKLIETKNLNNNIAITDTNTAVREIRKNFSSKKVKLVVTGGFHTRGLEKIFEREKVSYMILTPKITQSVDRAKEIYTDNVIYYSQIRKNMINIEPLEQEPLNVSFPKVLAGVFSVLQSGTFSESSKEDLQKVAEEFISQTLFDVSLNTKNKVEVTDFKLLSYVSDTDVRFSVKYKDNSNNGMESVINYVYSQGEVKPFADIDREKTAKMVQKVLVNNKYAAPTIELEPSGNARKQIGRNIIEPLEKISEGRLSLMNPSQVHMTIGFDSTLASASNEEMDALNNEDSEEIKELFSLTEILASDKELSSKMFLSGTVKLMPDGVIIYEINNPEVIGVMQNLRDRLKSANSKYNSPAIVHMTIGRISDASLLDGSVQSEEQLADILAKINETIYQINRQNALSKVKTSFSVKGGFVSSTGNEDFTVKRIVPQMQSLVVLKDLFENTKNRTKNIYKTVIAPVAEEFLFRFLPFSLASSVFGSSSLFIPVVTTLFTGSFLFPAAHTAADKLLSKNTVRDWKRLLPQAAVLTGVFVVLSVLFPQMPLLAVSVTIILHALNNIVSVVDFSKLPLLAVLTGSDSSDKGKNISERKYSQKDIDAIIDFVNNLGVDSDKEKYREIAESLKNLPVDETEKEQELTTQLNKFLELTIDTLRYYYSGSNDSPFYKLIPFMPYIMTEGKPMLDYVLDYLFEKVKFRLGKEYGSALVKMVAEVYDVAGFEKAVELYKMLAEKGVINKTDELDFTYRSRMSKKDFSDYEQLKIHCFAFNSLEADPRLENFIDRTLTYFNSFEIPYSCKDLFEGYLAEMEQLKDKINISLLPLLQYQLTGMINVVSKQIKENPSDETLRGFYFKVLEYAESLVEISDGKFKDIIPSYSSNIYEKCCSDIASVAVDAYNRNDTDMFEKTLWKMLKMAQASSKSFNPFYEAVCEGITDIPLKIYEPVVSGKITDEKESAARYNSALDVFKKLLSVCEDRNDLFNFMFVGNDKKHLKGLGFNEDTLSLFVETVRTAEYTDVAVEINRETDIIYSEKLAGIILSASLEIDVPALLNSLDRIAEENKGTVKSENCNKIIRDAILKIFKVLNSDKADIETKETAVGILVKIASGNLLFKYSDLLDLSEINRLSAEYNGNFYLVPSGVMYAERRKSFFSDEINTSKNEYAFTALLKKLNPELLEGTKLVPELPVIYESAGETNSDNKEVRQLREKFVDLQYILNMNNIVLSLLMKIPSSKKPEEDFGKLIKTLRNMISGFKKIHYSYGTTAELALNKILADLGEYPSPEDIKNQLLISEWEETRIGNIKEVHTLINAVHQLSIAAFKKTVSAYSVKDESVRTLSASQGNTRIKLYDLSTKRLSKDIVDFIGRLTGKNLLYPRNQREETYQINDFVCMNDILVWTTRLFAHSVDIFMDFSDENKEIAIYFHESARKKGNVERIRYFTTVLEKLGFKVESDTRESLDWKDGVCSMKATINKDSGLSETADIVDIAVKVIDLFKHSDMVDWDLENQHNRYSEESYNSMFDKFVQKFMDGFIWYAYEPNTQSAFGESGNSFTSTPEQHYVDIDIDAILDYLGLENKFARSRFQRGYKITQEELDRKFNDEIERAYAVGRIILDENGYLVKNENYNIVGYIASAIAKNETEALNASRIINLVGVNKFEFRSVGYIGSLVAVSGKYKLSDGNILAVKALINPETGRIKYSVVEHVSDSGRREIFTEELTDIFINEGFEISKNQEAIGEREKERITSLLHRHVRVIDSPEIHAVGTSDGNSTYVAGNVVFDKTKVNQRSILMLPYTTPDDIEAIKTAKGVITTGGGILSHAAISTRELNKPSAIINGVSWQDKKANLTWYYPSGPVEEKDGLSIKKLNAETSVLQEGTRVLINGETGHILSFADIDENIIDELQTAIDFDNAEAIKEILIKNSGSEYIRRLVEYVYFQTVGDSRMERTLSVLFEDSDWPEDIRAKIMELNEGYIQDKLLNIKEGINNLKNIENINILYSMVKMLKEKLSLIKYFGERTDFNELKEQIDRHEKEIKDQMLAFLMDLIIRINVYIEKTPDQWSVDEKEQIMNIIQQADVYNMFIDESEERVDLQALRAVVKAKLSVLDNAVKTYVGSHISSYSNEILGLKDIYAMDVYRFGSKTSELAKIYRSIKSLSSSKLNVPNGVGISANIFEEYFSLIGAGEEYRDLKNRFETAVMSGDKEAAKEAARKINALIDRKVSEISELGLAKLEDKIRTVVGITLRKDVKYSVRSSGIGEDSANNAFAGMGETFLNVTNDEIMDKIKNCWKSFYTDRTVEYMVTSGQIVRPAVLIQEMISVDESCVIFTRDKYGNAVINALYGLGEGIVSGQLTPDTITVDLQTGEIVDYSVATKSFEMVPDTKTGKGVVTRKVESGSKKRTFDSKTVKEFARVAAHLENDTGYKLDIEAGIKDGQIYVFQRRPITKSEKSKTQEPYVSISGDTKNIAFGFADVSEMDELVNITSPLNKEEALTVYMRINESGMPEFAIDQKYRGIIDIVSVARLLTARINTDNVVIDEINRQLSIFNMVANGKINANPVIDDVLDASAIEKAVNVDLDVIKNILASA